MTDWWPNRRFWPEYGPGSYSSREALALLILHGTVVVLAPEPEPPRAPTVHVICNDLFWWATADNEPLPLLGFGAIHEAPFWDLYARVRAGGHDGAEVWCCLRRGMRPQTPIERQWRETGLWTAELEALPARDPKECG